MIFDGSLQQSHMEERPGCMTHRNTYQTVFLASPAYDLRKAQF